MFEGMNSEISETRDPLEGDETLVPGGMDVFRVAIADKSPLVRAALTHLLQADPRFELAGVFPDADSFLAKVGDEAVDVCIVGWVMPDGGGKYILDHLQTIEAPPRTIVYTGAEGESVVAQVMIHGGAAYVAKREPVDFLLETVANVGRGRMVFPFINVRGLYDNPLATLTKREMEVLSSLAAGRTNKEIAREQGVSPNTVKFHVKNLYEKLCVRNRSEAIALYLRT